MNNDPVAWGETADRFNRARYLLSELAAALAHRVDNDPTAPAELRTEQHSYQELLQDLRVTDHQEIAQLLQDGPGRLAWLTAPGAGVVPGREL